MPTLMNRNVELCELSIDTGTLSFSKARSISQTHLFPFANPASWQAQDVLPRLNSWWAKRRASYLASYSGARTQLKARLEASFGTPLEAMPFRSYGLSLSDHYWLRPEKSIKWEDVNFFDNDFSLDVSYAVMGQPSTGKNAYSPDLATSGRRIKTWVPMGSERWLAKRGSILQPSAHAELLGNKVMRLALPDEYVADMKIAEAGNERCSMTRNVATKETEIVCMDKLLPMRAAGIEAYRLCKEVCEEHWPIIDLVLIADYILMYGNRGLDNIGMIRSARTGRLLYPAPVWNSALGLGNYQASMPFLRDFDEQAALVDITAYRDQIEAIIDGLEDAFAETLGMADPPEDVETALAGCKARAKKLLAMDTSRRFVFFYGNTAKW
ncbi:MAG: hypothetical protein LBC41_13285 [Clostridiales bacterium]|nr:hypothetical protein [Clostridiales bacterium]